MTGCFRDRRAIRALDRFCIGAHWWCSFRGWPEPGAVGGPSRFGAFFNSPANPPPSIEGSGSDTPSTPREWLGGREWLGNVVALRGFFIAPQLAFLHQKLQRLPFLAVAE